MVAKVLLYCSDVVGQAMAGPAIRSWEFAKALSKSHQVTLMVPNKPDITSDDFKIIQQKKERLIHDFKQADVIISQTISNKMALAAKVYGVKIILDAYDPFPFEHLEIFKAKSSAERWICHQNVVSDFNFYFRMADGIICANENQRHLWMGVLLSLYKITPHRYDQDNSFLKFIHTVPFGLSSAPPEYTGDGLRKMFNIKDSDKVVLWGGGIWNWFDPLTLIKAIYQISQKRSDVHLVFMGVKHPNEAIPEMKMAADAIQLAKELNLINKHVFINYNWVPYEQRANFLLEADIGMSTHFEHLETQYAFRTRMLDYIWAGLPIIGTRGDSFADLIMAKDIGLSVPPCDPQALEKAILHIIDQPEVSARMKKNLTKVREEFYWEKVVEPIHEMIEHLMLAPHQKSSWNDFKSLFRYLYHTRGPAATFRKIKNKLLTKANA